MAKELDEKLLVSIEVTQSKMMKQLDKLAARVAKAAKGYEDKFRSANKGVEQSANQAATAIERINKITGVDRSGFNKDRAADVAEYGRELDRLRAKYNPLFAASKQYESELDELNRALQLGAINADEHGAALTRLNSRYQAMATQANVAGKVVRNTRFETANIAAQLNDIGVQLAGGQSPFLIAIQQGTQLNQILGTAGGLRASVSLLGGAFASLVNPISLATIAIIGLGGAATQYFVEMLRGGEQTEESLRTQVSLIRQVADRWGDALPAVRDYANELERQEEIAKRNEAVQITINKEFEHLGSILPELKSLAADLSAELIGMGQSVSANQIAAELGRAENALEDYQDAMTTGQDTTEAFARVQESLAAFMSNEFVKDNNKAIQSLENLFSAFMKAAKAAEVLRAQNDAKDNPELKGRLGSQGLPPQDFARRFGWDEYFSFDKTDPGSSGGRSGGRRASAEAANRERDAVRELIENLEFERSLIGLSNVEREKAIALRRAGSAATAEDREAIGQNIEALHREREAFEQLQDAIEQSRQASEYLNQVLEQGILDAIPAIKTGNDALDNLLNTLVKLTAQAVLFGNGPLAGLFGGGFGLFGGGSSFIPTPGVGLFAKGGIAAHGKARPLPTFSRGGISKSAAIFGEAGPEAAVPLPDGRRIPVDLRMPQGAASSGASYAPTYNIDASGSSNPEQTRAVVTQALKEYDKGNYQRWLAAQGQARKRNAV